MAAIARQLIGEYACSNCSIKRCFLAQSGIRHGYQHGRAVHTRSPACAAVSPSGETSMAQPRHTNRLAKEQSPYLLQHQHNPVDWYPWGEEAFKAAREQDKPIFLSVGYATCHWCHVMEGESFESEETASIMNSHFINIKVDREERPDVDRVYMTFVQATTGGGGWPMSVWLTPDLKPFYGGTYYPAQDRFGMPSFTTVLRRIAQLWSTKRDDLQTQAASVMEQLQEMTAPDSPTGPSGAGGPSSQLLSGAIQGCTKYLTKSFDSKLGGFGGAPKFPRPSEINVLLRAAMSEVGPPSPTTDSSSGKQVASPSLLLGMALFSLQAMAAGGMYDQLGGGFHRYSVDEFWHVPHFEKMLYDNPQLVLTYLEAFRITLALQNRSSSSSSSGTPAAAAAADAGAALASPTADTAAAAAAAGGGGGGDYVVLRDPRVYATVARGVLDYLRRDMTHPDGGLYSAEDADSLDPTTNKKSEGAFYVWTEAELCSVLGAAGPDERASVFREVYGVKLEGNCTLSPRSDPHDEFKGKNVLAQFTRLDSAKSVKTAGLPLTRAEELLGTCRKDLFDRRATRPRPALDDKIVTAWNGQGISAFALAARTLIAERPPAAPCFPVEGCQPQTYMQAALGVAEFVHKHLWDASTKKLRRSYCKAPSSVEGFADDYALLIQGLLDLYETGGGLQWLQWAVELQDCQDQLFWDQAGGYFQTSGADDSVLLRLKEDYDGAEPAASSIAAVNLLRLATLLPQGVSPSSPGSSTISSSSGSLAMPYAERADAVLSGFSTRLQQAPIAMPQMCVAGWMKTRSPMRQVIIAGKASHPATSALLDAAHAAWAPDKAIILIDPTDPQSTGFWRQQNPEAWAMVEAHVRQQGTKGTPAAAAEPAGADASIGLQAASVAASSDAAAAAAATVAAGAGADAPEAPAGGTSAEQQQQVLASEVAAAGGAEGSLEPTAFVCQNYTCQAPTTSPQKLYELLSQVAGGAAGSRVKLQPVKL